MSPGFDNANSVFGRHDSMSSEIGTIGPPSPGSHATTRSSNRIFFACFLWQWSHWIAYTLLTVCHHRAQVQMQRVSIYVCVSKRVSQRVILGGSLLVKTAILGSNLELWWLNSASSLSGVYRGLHACCGVWQWEVYYPYTHVYFAYLLTWDNPFRLLC